MLKKVAAPVPECPAPVSINFAPSLRIHWEFLEIPEDSWGLQGIIEDSTQSRLCWVSVEIAEDFRGFPWFLRKVYEVSTKFCKENEPEFPRVSNKMIIYWRLGLFLNF